MRYMPELSISRTLSERSDAHAELSLNAFTHAPIDSPEGLEDNACIRLYSMWLRYGRPQFELRFGLQKINFGPARVLRSLMWF